MADRPNILLITSDQQRTDTLGCYGSDFAVSPNLDRLAGEGIRFTDCHSPCPVCMPARVSLLTGLNTPVHGCIENGFLQTRDHSVYPDLLADAGYTCIIAGKTHFGEMPRGFTVRYDLDGEKSVSTGIYPEHLRALGHEVPRGRIVQHDIPPEHFADAFITDSAMRGIDEARSAGQPWMCHCSLLSPHPPMDPPGQYATMFDGVALPPINYVPGEEDHFPRQLRAIQNVLGERDRDEGSEPGCYFTPDGDLDVENADRVRRLYYGLAAYVDAQVGRLMRFLEERGLAENTLVIFTSDHGHLNGDHGMICKHSWYDTSWRVPLIIRWPDRLGAGRVGSFANWTDLTATMLTAAGIDEDCFLPVQGFDLIAPACAGASSPRRAVAACLLQSSAVVTERWKYEWYPDERRGRLWDRVNDPLEQHDLNDSPEHRAVVDTIRHSLLAWRADQLDLEHLQTNQGGAGAMGVRSQQIADGLRGTDVERRLNTDVASLAQATPTVRPVKPYEKKRRRRGVSAGAR